jgi:hypothetical protein
MKKLLPLFIAVCLTIGCAGAAYKRSLEDLPKGDFSVDIPSGWWKPQHVNKYLVTKEDPFLQYVYIKQRPLDRPFTKTQKKLRKGMLPLESAKIILDELAADRNIMNFNILENTPATIDGHAGFKILFSYRDKKGSEYKTLYYGFISGDSYFNLRYTAAARHYYDKDLADFKSILFSFKVVKK